MKKLITKDGLEKLNNRLEEKTALIKRIREEKAHAYHASGDGWHDNPGWIQIGQQEELVNNEINQLQKLIACAKVVEKPNSIANIIQIGCRVQFKIVNPKTGLQREQTVTIAGTGEADLKRNLISYDSPIGTGLMGMCIGEEKTIQLPAGPIFAKVLNIYYE